MNRVKELQVWGKGEYRVVLDNGACYTLSRGYREHFDSFIKERQRRRHLLQPTALNPGFSLRGNRSYAVTGPRLTQSVPQSTLVTY